MEPLLLIWFAFVFVLGAAVGSGLNVCIVRIPYEKSILWPSSHCGKCFRPVRWYDNVPLISYWVLRGRCRHCGAKFSPRYFFIELFTALAFVGLFHVDIVANVAGVPYLGPKGEGEFIRQGLIPLRAWLHWAGHAVLLSFLIVTTFTDFEHMEIPLTVTVTGTLVGLVLATCFPWPWPSTMQDAEAARQAARAARQPLGPVPILGWMPWPVWRPDQLPAWMGPGTWQLGLASGLAGVAAGTILVRGVRFLFGVGRGQEGLGLGDADLMMMAGAFLGWQPVLIAFFVSVFPALLLGLGYLFVKGDQHLPFGPSLALGTLVTLFCWRWIGPQFELVYFETTMLAILAGAGAVFLLVISFVLRLTRGGAGPAEGVT